MNASALANRLREGEDVDWSHDKEDPDASVSTPLGPLELAGLKKDKDGIYSHEDAGRRFVIKRLFNDNFVLTMWWAKEVPERGGTEYTHAFKKYFDSEEALLDYLHGITAFESLAALGVVDKLLEAEDIDWAPDPEDPDVGTADGLSIERWVFTRSELKFPQACKGTDPLVAHVYDNTDEEGAYPLYMGDVMVLRNGTVLDYNSTGQSASVDMQSRADEVETLVSPLNDAETYEHWKDVYVLNGKFTGFAE